MLPNSYGIATDFKLIMMFDSVCVDGEVISLLGIYVQLVWDVGICKIKPLEIRNNEKLICNVIFNSAKV